MKRRRFDELRPRHLIAIQQWLDDLEEKGNNCPFRSDPGCLPCWWIFPKFVRMIEQGEIDSMLCPCDVYSLDYVKRVARKILRQKGSQE